MPYGAEPQVNQKDPRAYFLWLRAQGMPPMQATQAVEQRFGPPKTQEEINRENASSSQTNALAGTAGTVGGILATREIMQGFPNVKDALGYKPEPNFADSGSIGITRQVPNQTLDLDAIASSGTSGTSGGLAQGAPEVVKVDGATATVKLPTGQTQQVPTESLSDANFWGNVNWGQVAQGGLALAQMYGAYQSYKSGDKVGGTINMAAGAGNLAAATGAVATGAAAGTTGAYVIPGLNILAGGYAGYQTADALGDMAAGSKRTQTGVIGGATSGAAMGAGIGSFFGPGYGTAIGAGVGAVVGGIAGAVGSWTGSSKGKAQVMRDGIRGVLQENNILDKDFKGTLADGSTYDFGKDGSTLKWKEIDKVAEKNPNSWNSVVPLTDAIAAAYGFVGQKASDISAWYAKGAVSNAKDDPNTAIANARHFAQQQGLTYDQIKQKLDEAFKDERINQTQYDYYLGGAKQVTAGMPQSQPQGPATRPPAPLPQGTPQGPIQESGKKKSIRDILQSNMKK